MAISKEQRVFLVDDHPLIRRGLKLLLKRVDDLSVVGEASSGEEALDRIPSVEPDLAIVDLSMEGMDGFELTRRLKQQRNNLPVLIVSMHETTQFVKAALEAGADGYVLKSNVSEIITRASHQVLAGRQFLCKKVRQRLRQRL